MVVTYSEVLFRCFLKGAEENHEKPHPGQSVSRSRQETDIFQTKSEVLLLEPSCIDQCFSTAGPRTSNGP
jgi:hypothetical protein